jgi:hypothetical protein
MIHDLRNVRLPSVAFVVVVAFAASTSMAADQSQSALKKQVKDNVSLLGPTFFCFALTAQVWTAACRISINLWLATRETPLRVTDENRFGVEWPVPFDRQQSVA